MPGLGENLRLKREFDGDDSTNSWSLEESSLSRVDAWRSDIASSLAPRAVPAGGGGALIDGACKGCHTFQVGVVHDPTGANYGIQRWEWGPRKTNHSRLDTGAVSLIVTVSTTLNNPAL